MIIPLITSRKIIKNPDFFYMTKFGYMNNILNRELKKLFDDGKLEKRKSSHIKGQIKTLT